jgi:hypothetical protein
MDLHNLFVESHVAYHVGTFVEDVQCCRSFSKESLLVCIMTQPDINTFVFQHVKDYVCKGLEKYKRDI